MNDTSNLQLNRRQLLRATLAAIHGITCTGFVSHGQIPAKTSGRRTPFRQVAMSDAETPQQYTRSGSTGNRLNAIATAAAKTSQWSITLW